MTFYLPEVVGRSLEQASVHAEDDVFVARYYARSQVLMTREQVAESPLPPVLLKRSMDIQAGLMARFADQADEYAMRRFSPPVLARYFMGMIE